MLPYLTEQELDELKSLADDASPPFADWCAERSGDFNWSWPHLVAIRQAVHEVIELKLYDRLILTVPPRHGKSEQVTMRIPPYLLERDPTQRFIIAAYNAELAKYFSGRAQGLFAGRLDRKRQAVGDWSTYVKQGKIPGGVRAAGVGTGVTGRGAHGIIIDDPIKSREEALSPTYRDKLWNWWLYDLKTRLEPGGWCILILTRWHHDDLAGRLLASPEADEWRVLNLEAICESDDDPLGREKGQALCPDRYDEQALERIRLGSPTMFGALYQGKPTPDDGSIFKSGWWQRYDRPFERPDMIVQSWDCANKAKDLNDYSVCSTWQVLRNGDVELIHVSRARREYPDLERFAKQNAALHNADVVLIEDKGNGTALIQSLKAKTGLRIVAIEPEGDKVMRASMESVAYEAGRVYHPPADDPRYPWLHAFETELLQFPAGTWDDQVDSTTQFLRWHFKGVAMDIDVATAGPRVTSRLVREDDSDARPIDQGEREPSLFASTGRRVAARRR